MFHLHETAEEWILDHSELDELIRERFNIPEDCNIKYDMQDGKIEVTAWRANSSGEHIRINPKDIDTNDYEGTDTEDIPS